MTANRLDLGLSLLDRQLVDRDGRPVGKVDDIRFDWPDGGGPPIVSKILVGPIAFGERFGRPGGPLWSNSLSD